MPATCVLGGCSSFNDVKNGMRLNCRITRHMNYFNFSVDSQAVRGNNMVTFEVVKPRLQLF